jgi:transposase InsO family protein
VIQEILDGFRRPCGVWFDLGLVGVDASDVADGTRSWLTEHRYRAVLQVQQGVAVTQVAREVGASRQSVYSWVARYEAEGLAGLAERSRRPRTSPTRMAPEVEAMICELRRSFPRWGAQRIAHELTRQAVPSAPGRSSVYRVLVRNGLVAAQQQNHKRRYRRWQRDAPMQLWQLDIMGGVFLADGRECKLVTGIDDHSRFMVIATVVTEPSARAVCAAFTAAMARYGVPTEVLTDNGKQFTGRFTRPRPAEVLFERICRENGITARLTKPRSPTTTGKIERWHKTLRRELLDAAGPFADLAAAQAAIDVWVAGYNQTRPHQSLAMSTPASVFRPAPLEPAAPMPPLVLPDEVGRLGRLGGVGVSPRPLASRAPQITTVDAAVAPVVTRAVEWEARLSPIGRLCLPGNQQIKFAAALAHRQVTVWADDRSIHVLLDGHLIRTRPSRFSEPDLRDLLDRGGRPAGPEPGPASLPPVAPSASPPTTLELERTVARDGDVGLGGQRVLLDPPLAGQRVTLRFDGQLLHVIAEGLLVKTLPAPIGPDQRARLIGARATTTPLPPPPAQPLRAIRRVPADGVAMVAGQRLRIGRAYAGQTVSIAIEDTVFRVLLGDVDLSTHARRPDRAVTRFKAHARSSATT